MHPPEDMTRVVDGKRYSVKKAELIAHDAYWDGHNFERQGRNQFLYKTEKGNYFVVNMSQWEGELDTLHPVGMDEAIMLYEQDLPEHLEVEYEEAFPGIEVEDA